VGVASFWESCGGDVVGGAGSPPVGELSLPSFESQRNGPLLLLLWIISTTTPTANSGRLIDWTSRE
jgi:hypothetical protein